MQLAKSIDFPRATWVSASASSLVHSCWLDSKPTPSAFVPLSPNHLFAICKDCGILEGGCWLSHIGVVPWLPHSPTIRCFADLVLKSWAGGCSDSFAFVSIVCKQVARRTCCMAAPDSLECSSPWMFDTALRIPSHTFEFVARIVTCAVPCTPQLANRTKTDTLLCLDRESPTASIQDQTTFPCKTHRMIRVLSCPRCHACCTSRAVLFICCCLSTCPPHPLPPLPSPTLLAPFCFTRCSRY